jgi:integrase
MAAARDRAPEMNVWSPDELSRFLRHVENYRAGALVHLAAMTGMRRGELVALRWGAVDLARSTVTVRVAASFLGGVERVEVPKTKRSRRTIDLDQRTAFDSEATSSDTARGTVRARDDVADRRPGVFATPMHRICSQRA